MGIGANGNGNSDNGNLSATCLYRLWVDTVNALGSCGNDGSTSGDSAYTSEDLVEDPLLVLKCDPRVFR